MPVLTPGSFYKTRQHKQGENHSSETELKFFMLPDKTGQFRIRISIKDSILDFMGLCLLI